MFSNKPLPPRDWPAHWKTYIGHGLLGALVALMMLSAWPVSGCAILACYLVYQTVEVIRRLIVPLMSGVFSEDEIEQLLRTGDTPARDVADFMVGLIPVVSLGWAIKVVFPAVSGIGGFW